jgi:hypothetical protein
MDARERARARAPAVSFSHARFHSQAPSIYAAFGPQSLMALSLANGAGAPARRAGSARSLRLRCAAGGDKLDLERVAKIEDEIARQVGVPGLTPVV